MVCIFDSGGTRSPYTDPCDALQYQESILDMTILDQPSGMDTSTQSDNGSDSLAIFATVSVIVGILDLPVLFCGWVLAITSLIYGAEYGGDPFLVLSIILFVLPIVLWLVGVALCIAGLGSKRRMAAIIGIVLSVLSPLLVYGILVASQVF